MNEDTSFAEEAIRVGSKKKGRKPKAKVAPAEGIHATKEYAQYLKSHDAEQAEAFLSKSNEDLKRSAVYCLVEIADETEQIEQNENYRKAKEDLKAFNDALKDAIKPLKDTIALSTLLLRERGETFNPALKELGVEISIK